MSVAAPPPSLVLLRAREPSARAWLEGVIGGLGARAADLDAVPDSDLFDPSASEPIVAQTGGPRCPLDRLLCDAPGGPILSRPVILLAERPGLEHVARRLERSPHAVLLAEPCEPPELISVLRASLSAQARRRQVHRMMEELRHANEELDRRRQDAEIEALRRTQFLAAISHDLRTPLYEIALVAQLAQARPREGEAAPPIDWDRLASGLRAGVQVLRERVDDLFDLARLDLGAVHACAEPFLLGPFLERTLAPFRVEAESRGLRLEVEAPPPWTEIVADSDKLARVLQNLTSNAVKFTDAGEVRITARLDPPGELVLSVRDTGRGIASSEVSTIFDEFAQLGNPERDRTKGTGLGLAICRRLAKVLGGRIDVQSEPGRGSEFTLSVPVARDKTLGGTSPILPLAEEGRREAAG